ncbi:iron-sulfur cluster biosynthesis family protein [Lacticaseibacillus daqingensis]|uniref:iron-sulfur cluster biosynthesis family protein n=1 Tax=Lacticaseibacillus daqingensis TaxID=2486014 RepID=UPI000F76B086|nr:iron-sulfur cluster biosynthesis family protein [Lacticaseibacillus daqingensis]
MEIQFDAAAMAKLTPHLVAGKQLLMTFEDGVGPYSQHAMIHMQVQFTLNVVAADADLTAYDTTVDSNLGPVLIKGYSTEDLDDHMAVHLNEAANTMSLTGDGGMIDSNLGFIDFTAPNSVINPAR